MTSYPYRPLDLTKDSTRLLRIRKGGIWSDLICELFEASPGVTYTALSYTWGGLEHAPTGAVRVPRVIVDGHEFTPLMENLHHALWHIRRPDSDVILWADAICINQSDRQEKGHQVKQMGAIYKAAEEVLIWLGPSDADIQSLFELVTWIDEEAIKAQALGNTEDWMSLCRGFRIAPRPAQVQALAELLGRPWFARIWVLQEVAKARTATIMCGSSTCPARTFAFMPSLLGLAVNEQVQAVLDIMPRFRKNTWWSSTRSLHFLLNKFAGSQSSVRRDKVYALLGMSEDASDPNVFYPCYQKSDDQFCRDTASFLLFGEILGHRDYLPDFTIPMLRLPVSQLAARALGWALCWSAVLHLAEQAVAPVGCSIGDEATALRKSAREETSLLISRINERQLNVADMLLLFATQQGQLYEMMRILSPAKIDLNVDFEAARDVLTATSREDGSSVRLAFPPDGVGEEPLKPDVAVARKQLMSVDKITRLVQKLASRYYASVKGHVGTAAQLFGQLDMVLKEYNGGQGLELDVMSEAKQDLELDAMSDAIQDLEFVSEAMGFIKRNWEYVGRV